MKHLKKPDIMVEDIYCVCSRDFRDKDLVARLLSCKAGIAEASEKFEELATKHETYKMKEKVSNEGIVTGEELKKIYTQKFAAKNSVGKSYYSEILAIPDNHKCPLCGARDVSTLDHYLAKSSFPSLVLSPNNLVAACRDCNFDKSDNVFTSNENETLHPYYDYIEEKIWVYCNIIESDPVGFKYGIQMADATDITLYKRIKNHFEIFNLELLYSIKACEMFYGIESMLKRLYTRAGKEAVRLQIEEDMLSWETKSINSWQSALYRGINNSGWFFTEWLK